MLLTSCNKFWCDTYQENWLMIIRCKRITWNWGNKSNYTLLSPHLILIFSLEQLLKVISTEKYCFRSNIAAIWYNVLAINCSSKILWNCETIVLRILFNPTLSYYICINVELHHHCMIIFAFLKNHWKA